MNLTHGAHAAPIDVPNCEAKSSASTDRADTVVWLNKRNKFLLTAIPKNKGSIDRSLTNLSRRSTIFSPGRKLLHYPLITYLLVSTALSPHSGWPFSHRSVLPPPSAALLPRDPLSENERVGSFRAGQISRKFAVEIRETRYRVWRRVLINRGLSRNAPTFPRDDQS